MGFIICVSLLWYRLFLTFFEEYFLFISSQIGRLLSTSLGNGTVLFLVRSFIGDGLHKPRTRLVYQIVHLNNEQKNYNEEHDTGRQSHPIGDGT